MAKVCVIGTGTMGQGIAQLAAARGFTTSVVDVDEARSTSAVAAVVAQLEKLVQKGKLTDADRTATIARLSVARDLTAACAGVDYVIEAVPEDMALKVDLFRKVIEASPQSALLGSNTSSLSLTELGTKIGAPDRTIGLHFFNPPPIMELLEIVRGLGTSTDTVDRALAFAKELGKTAIVVSDTPGFASSRLGVILGAEAMRMLESGVASAADIDKAMELGYRHPMGPLKLTDLVGLDVRLAILDHLTKEVGEQFRAPPILRRMVRAGKLGKKTGEGFYVWKDGVPTPKL
ncbi:3-hydroxyacyl-CoA dehydrogenase family protein [soil metagenome]